MDILNEDEFSRLIKEIFDSKNITYGEIDHKKRKNALLKQELFFDLSRNHHAHIPDLYIEDENISIPCELKSPEELYDACHYSRAHLYSYILQTIYGQCYSYADLFRPNDDCLSIFLILPKIVRRDLASFGDIEDIFRDILTQNWQSYITQMELDHIEFQSPTLSNKKTNEKYGKIGDKDQILMTKIKYIRK
jgi:hypothetical protein